MTFLRTIALVATLGLVGCVTTEVSGDASPVANPKEAAQINQELGIAYLRQGNYEQARTKLEKAVNDDPDLATAHSALGLVYERLGAMDNAEDEYRRAVRLEGKDPNTLNALAVFLCAQRNEPDDALRYFDRALEYPLFPNRVMVFTNAGVCARKVDLQMSEDYFRRALALEPTSSVVLLQLSDVAFQQGNYLQSRGFLERYITTIGVSPAVLWLGVHIETALGDAKAAEIYGQRLKAEFPTAVETRMLLEKERDAG
jgi:type IV pilus assembly protein PilF